MSWVEGPEWKVPGGGSRVEGPEWNVPVVGVPSRRSRVECPCGGFPSGMSLWWGSRVEGPEWNVPVGVPEWNVPLYLKRTCYSFSAQKITLETSFRYASSLKNRKIDTYML